MSTAPPEPVARASQSSVGSLFRARVRQFPDRVAIEGSAAPGRAHADQGPARLTYRELDARVARLAGALAALGVRRGERVALLSENRPEYLEVMLAASRLGASVACQNWRLTAAELAHCIQLVTPVVLLVSPRFAERVAGLDVPSRVLLGDEYERLLAAAAPLLADDAAEPEDALLILYTSGTTGLPKGAVLSHRSEIARNLVVRAEFGITPEDTFPAWSPLYHMGAAEPALGALMSGGKVVTIDGFDAGRLAELVERETLGWLLLMPGMVGTFADELERRAKRPRGVKLCGVMADLVPPSEIARVTRLLDAPYANTFGATETGCPPCSSNRIPIGVAPTRLSKQQSPFCEVRLVDPDDRDVPDGSPGELCIRGPTLFSGYYRAEATNAEDFRGGWFHMGDVFVRNPDGTLDFVDRVKYLIKSGGENIYPAEIERVLLADERVVDAAVVRRPDPKWGEVPVAFVALRDQSAQHGAAPLEAADLYRRCRGALAGYKQPKDIIFILADEFPRSASGKIQRHELEKRLRPSPREEHRAHHCMTLAISDNTGNSSAVSRRVMKLYMHPVSMTSRPVRLFIAESGIKVDEQVVDLMTGEHLQPAFAAINPSKMVPVLEDGDLRLTESSTILKYLADKTDSPAYPKDLKQRARVNEVMDWFNSNFYRDFGYGLCYPQLFPHHKRPTDAVQQATLEWAQARVQNWLSVLNDHILGKDRRYLVGSSLTIADYFGACLITLGEVTRCEFGKYPNIQRWLDTMKQLPSWPKVNEALYGYADYVKAQQFVTF